VPTSPRAVPKSAPSSTILDRPFFTYFLNLYRFPLNIPRIGTVLLLAWDVPIFLKAARKSAPSVHSARPARPATVQNPGRAPWCNVAKLQMRCENIYIYIYRYVGVHTYIRVFLGLTRYMHLVSPERAPRCSAAKRRTRCENMYGCISAQRYWSSLRYSFLGLTRIRGGLFCAMWQNRRRGAMMYTWTRSDLAFWRGIPRRGGLKRLRQ